MDEMDDVNVEPTDQELLEEEKAPLPPFYKRVADIFFNPARLGRILKEHPVWAVAMVVGALLTAAMILLIPEHVWIELQRQSMMKVGRAGRSVPASTQAIMHWFRPLAGAFGLVVSEFVYAGIVTLIFAFIMGDNGRYRQYLAVVAHAWLITVVIEFLLLPLKIHQGTPQATVSIGTFFVFLPQGYLLKVLSSIALSKLWAALVIAAGVHGIDPKRKIATAATVLIILSVAVSFATAAFTPTL